MHFLHVFCKYDFPVSRHLRERERRLFCGNFRHGQQHPTDESFPQPQRESRPSATHGNRLLPTAHRTTSSTSGASGLEWATPPTSPFTGNSLRAAFAPSVAFVTATVLPQRTPAQGDDDGQLMVGDGRETLRGVSPPSSDPSLKAGPLSGGRGDDPTAGEAKTSDDEKAKMKERRPTPTGRPGTSIHYHLGVLY